jgi:hypothetical protein
VLLFVSDLAGDDRRMNLDRLRKIDDSHRRRISTSFAGLPDRKRPVNIGGRSRTRTLDPLITRRYGVPSLIVIQAESGPSRKVPGNLRQIVSVASAGL